jgi:RNA polymerase sigma-70 factor (ECF subfamily)
VKRNRGLFWELIENEHAKARAFCHRLAGHSGDGDDLYQDAVIKAYRGFDGLRDPDLFRPWFYQIINNTYRNRFRSAWWKKLVSFQGEIEPLVGSSDPSGAYDARRRLDYALSALKAEDRVIVILAELEGWAISELALMTSRSEASLKMRLSRARKSMRNKLARLCRRSRIPTAVGGSELICSVTKPERD